MWVWDVQFAQLIFLLFMNENLPEVQHNAPKLLYPNLGRTYRPSVIMKALNLRCWNKHWPVAITGSSDKAYLTNRKSIIRPREHLAAMCKRNRRNALAGHGLTELGIMSQTELWMQLITLFFMFFFQSIMRMCH